MNRHPMQPLANWLQHLSARHKRAMLIAVDTAVGASTIAVLGLVNDDPLAVPLVLAGAVVTGGASAAFGLDRIKLNTFVHEGMLRSLAVAAILALAISILALDGRYRLGSAAIEAIPLAFAGIVLARAILLRVVLVILQHRDAPIRVLIYGAGKTGQQLAAALRAHDTIQPVGFLDDDPELQGSSLAGLRVFAPTGVAGLAHRHRIDRVLIAMPSQPAAKLMRLSHELQAMGLEVQALPSFAQLTGTRTPDTLVHSQKGHEVLSRTELAWDQDRHQGAYKNRSVMVTGAGGSVGAELCRQLLALAPRRLVLFEQSELALYTINRDLTALPSAKGIDIRGVLGSVGDERLLRDVLADGQVDVVIHAAAYKHVPLVEANPVAGLENNVFGTLALARAAHAARIERFILISTDKAVRPTSMMGASKRLAELVVQDMARRLGRPHFSIVRFGNVIGSSGSVIPLFRQQIAAGGPVTLTHDDVTRYFMSLAEAAQLVLFAGALDRTQGGGQGSIFALDMGAPMRIRDLAVQMIGAAGLAVRDDHNPGGDVDIRVIGLRPGEKLHEEVLIGPGMVTTPHPKILRAVDAPMPPGVLSGTLQALRAALDAGDDALARLIVDATVGPDAPGQAAILQLPLNEQASERA